MAAVVPFMEEMGIDVPAHHDAEADRYVIDCPFPARFDAGAQALAARRGRDQLGRGDDALEGARPDERGLRRAAAEGLPVAHGGGGVSVLTHAQRVEARLWRALQDVEDPEIPISVVGMGLIVSLAYREEERAVDLELTFTAMGCPAMDFIEDDIRERLLAEPRRRGGADRGGLGPGVDPQPHPRGRARDDALAGDRGMTASTGGRNFIRSAQTRYGRSSPARPTRSRCATSAPSRRRTRTSRWCRRARSTTSSRGCT